VEFGRKVWLEEVERRHRQRLAPARHARSGARYLVRSLEAHRLRFGKPLRLVTADRGVFSRNNETQPKQVGVQHVVIPVTGQVTPERQRWFRHGFRFRAGIE
jgi:hypothetical protein